MSTLATAIHADAARIAYRQSLQLAAAAHAASKLMQWRVAARLFNQAADAVLPDPHGATPSDAHLYRIRAGVCRAMIPCALPVRALPDTHDYDRRLLGGAAA